MRFRFSGVILATIMAGVLLLASCTGTPGPTSPSSAGSATSATTKPYGSVIVATNVGSGQIDPLLSTPVGFNTVGGAIFDSLYHNGVYFNPPFDKPTPGIAERWEISPDGLTHTFYLRKGVKFQNGDDLTAADVKFSIDRLMNPANVLLTDAAIWRAAVASVEVKDDYTVAIRMKQPQFELLMNSHGAMGAVMPKKYIESKGEDYFGKNPVGSGPWKVVKFDPGTRVELEALDNHWRAVPKFKNLTILSVREESTKVAMLKTGELDVAVVAADSVPNLKAVGLRISSYVVGGMYGFPLYDRDKPKEYAFGDVRVRKAIQLAINGKEVAEKLFGGYAEPSVAVATLYAEWPSKVNSLDPVVLQPHPYDLEGAKKLLVEAGYPNGFSTRIMDTGGGDIRSLTCQVVSGYWGKIGINAAVVPMDYGAFNTAYKARNPETFNSVYVLSMPGARPWDMMINLHHSTRSSPKNVKNPRLDWVLENIASTADPTQREKLVVEAMRLARDEYNVTSVVGMSNIIVLGQKVGDIGQARNAYEVSGLMYETISHPK